MLLLFSYISAIKRLVLEGSFSQRSKITRCSRSHRLNLAHLSIITEENRVSSEDTPWDNPHHSQTAREDIRTFPSLHFLILTDAFATSCTKAKVHRTLDFGRLISFLTRCRSRSLQLFSPKGPKATNFICCSAKKQSISTNSYLWKEFAQLCRLLLSNEIREKPHTVFVSLSNISSTGRLASAATTFTHEQFVIFCLMCI